MADAIEREALGELKGELGDLLFQVVFHARMAQEAGLFDFEAVAADICAKLERRHPHVFGDAQVKDSAEQTRVWEDIKRQERAAAGAVGLLDDVPANLPGLSRAMKLGKRAATVGFRLAGHGRRARQGHRRDRRARCGGRRAAARLQVAAEMGDLLFTIANWCRHLNLDPDTCVRAASGRFRAAVPRRGGGGRWPAAAAGTAHDAAALDALWRRAKAAEA